MINFNQTGITAPNYCTHPFRSKTSTKSSRQPDSSPSTQTSKSSSSFCFFVQLLQLFQSAFIVRTGRSCFVGAAPNFPPGVCCFSLCGEVCWCFFSVPFFFLRFAFPLLQRVAPVASFSFYSRSCVRLFSGSQSGSDF